MRVAFRRLSNPTLVAPWGNAFGLARTLLALSVAGTLLLSPSSANYVQLGGGERISTCTGSHSLSMFCWVPAGDLWTLQIAAGLCLILIATGWRPAITSIPLAYIVTSYTWSTVIPDGGDQLASILSMLLIPVGLTDTRKWHWAFLEQNKTFSYKLRLAISNTAIILIKIQVSIVYLTSSIGKLSNGEWTNGTAIYYWFRQPNFGIPSYLSFPMDWLGVQPLFVAAVTWGTLGLEFIIGVALLLPKDFRIKILLPIAIVFHLGIGIFMGISSFSTIMISALILLLIPIGTAFRFSITHNRQDQTNRILKLPTGAIT